MVHRCDVNLEVRREVPHLANTRCWITRIDGDNGPMVEELRWFCRKLSPIECVVGLHNDGPCVGVRGGLALEIPRVEFGDGGVEIVVVEYDSRHDLSGVIDLEDVHDRNLEVRQLAFSG